MPRSWRMLAIASTLNIASAAQVSFAPSEWLSRLSLGSNDNQFLWNWFGADGTVSIYDRSPSIVFPSRPASFGPVLADPLLGYVFPLDAFAHRCNDSSHVVDGGNRGCPGLCIDGPRRPDGSETWIALVQRGGCRFADKVREAQRLGASAVIVGGENPELHGNPDVLVNMYSDADASDLKASSAFIRYADYVHLLHLIATSNTSTAGIQTLPVVMSTDFSWTWWSPILTFVLLLLFPSCLTLATILIHRFRSARQARRDRAPHDVVHRLPARIWTGMGAGPDAGPEKNQLWSPLSPTPIDPTPFSSCIPSHHDLERGPEEGFPQPSSAWFASQNECAICLAEFAPGDVVRILPCNHMFHLDEVDVWLLQRKKLCPICKRDVTQGICHDTTAPNNLPSSSTINNERTPLLMQHPMS